MLVEAWHHKVGTRPHVPARGIKAAGEKWHMEAGAWIGFWLRCFEKSCRSPLCAPNDVVGVGKYHQKKMSSEKSPENIAGKMLTVMRVL